MILPTLSKITEALNADNLPVEVKEIALAVLNDKPVKQYSLPDMLRKLDVLINQTHVHCNFQYKPEIVVPTIELLATDLAMEYGGLTFGEIEIAFKRGWKGNYGDFLGLSNKTYFKWVKYYCDEESRFSAKKAIENAKKEASKRPEPTEQEKEQMIKEGIIYLFNQFKTGARCIVPSTFYDYLYRKEIINYTSEMREGFKQQAKAEIIAEKEIDKKQALRFGARISDYIAALDNHNNEDLITRGKSIAVKYWFNSLVEMGEEATEYLK